MSFSYFPYQPPAHVAQLSVQGISVTKPSDSISAAEGKKSSSTTASHASYPQEKCPKATTPEAKAYLERKIQSNFEFNLSEHENAYMGLYAGKDFYSYAESKDRQARPGEKCYPEGHFDLHSYSERSKQEDIARTKAAESTLKKGAGASGRSGRRKTKGLSNHRKNANSSDGNASG